jgi:PAS domain S-box-containing protein
VWQAELAAAEKKANALSELISAIGYGGMIHDFKNYVLRQSDESRSVIEASLSRAYARLDDLDAMLVTPADFKATFAIRQTLKLYESKLAIIEALIRDSAPPQTIDQKVRVDDSDAKAALSALIDQAERGKKFSRALAEAKSARLLQTTYIGLAFLIPFTLGGWRLARSLSERESIAKEARQTAQDSLKLLEASAGAVVTVSSSGKVAFANRAACRLTEYSRRELEGMNVDELVPSPLRALHKPLRDAFFEAPDERSMAPERSIVLMTKAGAEIPVAISLSPVRRRGELLVVASMVKVSAS